MTEPKPFASLSSGLLARKGTAKPAMRPQGYGKYGAGLDDLGWNDMGHVAQPEVPQPSAFEQPHDDHVPSPISALTPMTSGFDEESEFEPGPAIVEQQRAEIEARFGEPSEERSVLSTKTPRPSIFNDYHEQETAESDFDSEMNEDEEAEARQYEPEMADDENEDVIEAYEPEPEAYQPVFEPEPEAHVETVAEAAIVAASLTVERQAERTARAKAAFTLRLDGDRHLKLRLACAVSGRSAQQLVTEALDQLLHSKPEVAALAGQVPAKAAKPT